MKDVSIRKAWCFQDPRARVLGAPGQSWILAPSPSQLHFFGLGQPEAKDQDEPFPSSKLSSLASFMPGNLHGSVSHEHM